MSQARSTQFSIRRSKSHRGWRWSRGRPVILSQILFFCPVILQEGAGSSPARPRVCQGPLRTSPSRRRRALPVILPWINDAGRRSYYCGSTMLGFAGASVTLTYPRDLRRGCMRACACPMRARPVRFFFKFLGPCRRRTPSTCVDPRRYLRTRLIETFRMLPSDSI